MIIEASKRAVHLLRHSVVIGCAVVLLFAVSACGVFGTHIRATASIPAETLQNGELMQVFIHGVFDCGGSSMALMSVEMDHGKPVAWIAVGPGGGPRGDGTYPLHLGETLDQDRSLLLVSFDVPYDVQAVTFMCQYN